MSKIKKPARQKGSRIGIAARIYAALGVLTVLTIAASLVAWFSYGRVGSTVADMVERKMPVVELALELSQAATASGESGLPHSAASIARAARLPWPIATVTVRSPKTASPPA